MTDVTITVTSDALLLLTHLHHPGEVPPATDLAYGSANHLALPDGFYHVSLSGTGQPPGTVVSVTFAATNSKTRTKRVSPQGTIAAFAPFKLAGGIVT
jgi:hypothetical protein